MASPTASGAVQQLRPCEVCEHILNASFNFLCHYQYELSVSPDVQQSHAERGGLCLLHTWQYASLASTHGICTGYPALLDRLSAWFRDAASTHPPQSLAAKIQALFPTEETCVLCRACAEAETKAMSRVARELEEKGKNAVHSLSAICLPHLQRLVASVEDAEIVQEVVVREALILDRLSEDMRRYATKHDAIRRFLASDEETKAGHLAVTVLAGLRNAIVVR